MKNVAALYEKVMHEKCCCTACIWKVFRIGMFGCLEHFCVGLHWFRGSFHVLACVQGELCWIIALVVFALCVPMAWSPSCLPCEESVRVLLSSDLVFVLCLAFDHLLSLWFFVVVFLSFFIW